MSPPPHVNVCSFREELSSPRRKHASSSWRLFDASKPRVYIKHHSSNPSVSFTKASKMFEVGDKRISLAGQSNLLCGRYVADTSAVGVIVPRGKLYEGNYARWRPCMDHILQQCRLLDTSTAWQSARAADIIAAQVQSSFLKRSIPDIDRRSSTRLLQRLEEHARPFRFFDLPPELRNRVYDLHFSEDALRPITEKIPQITRATKQLRGEALPVFYSCTRFSIRFDKEERSLMKHIADVKTWAKRIDPAYLPKLRSLTLQLDVRASSLSQGPAPETMVRDFKLIFSLEKALRIRIPRDLSRLSEVQLIEYINEVEEERQVLGITGGNALILAVSRGVSLWSREIVVDLGRDVE